MPSSTEQLSTSSENENSTFECPPNSENVPSYSEHMTEKENIEQIKDDGNSELSIDERQKYIEDPEERKAKIQTILQELTPEDIFNDDFNPEEYQGDNANDFFDDLGDSFILQHIDDLMSCGVKAGKIDEFTNELFTQNEANDMLIENLEPILSHVGHGITFDTFMEICDVDLDEEDDKDPLIPAAKYILDKAFEVVGGDIDPSTVKTMLKNGFTANQIIAAEPPVCFGLHQNMDTLLDAGADPNKIVDLYASQGMSDQLLSELDNLSSRGASNIDIDQVLGDIAHNENSDYLEYYTETLLKYGVDKKRMAELLEENHYDVPPELSHSISIEKRNPNEHFIEFVENCDNDAQVKEKLGDFISRGVNIGYIINFFCYKDGSIDENGTNNIELDLNDQNIIKGFEELLQYVGIDQILSHLSIETIAMNQKYLEDKGANLKPYEESINNYFTQIERQTKKSHTHVGTNQL